MFQRVHLNRGASHGCQSLARGHKAFDAGFFKGWPIAFGFPRDLRWGLDVDATDQEYVVKAEFPGFDVTELNVQLDGDLLTLVAEKKPQDENNVAQRSVQRKVKLPEDIDLEKIEAKYVNGVLEVRVAKSEAAKSRKIVIKT